MGIARPALQADFLFNVGELSAEDLKVSAFRGTEGISRLYSYRVELVSDDPDIAYSAVLGKPCGLDIRNAAGTRFVKGIVRSFERTGQGNRLTHYAAEIVPIHWVLTKRIKSRIFQEHNCPGMTVQDIVRKVLVDAGIPAEHFRFALQGAPTKHEYVVQYRESDFDFISRLMELEGICYFFEHMANTYQMVITNSGVGHVVTPFVDSVTYRDPTGMLSEGDQEYLDSVRDREEIQQGAVSLDDFNFETPDQNLIVTQATGQNTSLEYSDYPGAFPDKTVGGVYAQLRLEEFQAARRVQVMRGGIRALMPGFKFTMVEHPTDTRNIEYLVTRLSCVARQGQSGEEEAGENSEAGYGVEIETIPATVPFRPARVTPRPTVLGTQTALVVGPAGEEIYTDKYGRVKVQFHWDREGAYDEFSSCWIRVSQGSAGGQYGMMFLPRIGHEVVVDFLEGDPNRPLIVGRVFNKDMMPPYPLPDEKTKSTIKTHSSKGGGGCNEVRFEDLKGKEQLLIQAQRQMDTRVKASHFHTTGGNYELKVGGCDQYGEMFGEYRQLVYKLKQTHVKEDVRTTIDRDESHEVKGKVSINIGGTKSTTVGGDVVDMFNENHKEEVTATYALKAASIKLEATDGIEIICGGSAIHVTPGAVFIKGGPTVNINSGSGPAVTTPSAGATGPEPAEDARGADSSKPGRDKRYSGQPNPFEPIDPEDIDPNDPDDPDNPVTPKTWVAIELVDEEGKPCAGERYRLTLPDGRIKEGTLDANGRARVGGLDPGNCQVTFPKLDATTWQRLG